MADDENVKADSDRKTPPPAKKKKRAILKKGQLLVGNYEVVDQIGEGGMAVVYKALQKSLKRHVAIKALNPRLARDPEFVERFEAEAGALANLAHPNIVSIIDRGSEDNVFFFIMEYVAGEDLDQKIIHNRLTPNDWRQIVAACADALEYVHKHGVVHRDIKPSNILIDPDGRVKISDFGIAHIIEGDDENSGSQDESGAQRAMGTRHYMAPEQSATPGNIDARADIYALGVTFYKMMVRKLPVGDYAAPSELNNEVPLAVDEVLFRAMAPDREDRYQTVREFCDDLGKALKDSGVSITSIMNYRSKAGSSLYSGEDFSRGSSASVDLKGTTSADRKSGTGTGTGTGTGRRTSKSAVKMNTGTGTGTGSTGGKTSGTQTAVGGGGGKSNTMLIAIVVILLLAGIGVIIGVTMMPGEGSNTPAAPVVAPKPVVEDTRSEGAKREEALRIRREEMNRQIMEGSISEQAPQMEDQQKPEESTPVQLEEPTAEPTELELPQGAQNESANLFEKVE